MAVKWSESRLSRQGTTGPGARFDFIYSVWSELEGAETVLNTVEEMQTYLLTSVAPSSYTGLPRGSAVSRTTNDGMVWTFVVPYGFAAIIQSPSTRRRVQIGGRTETIKTSLATVGQYGNILPADVDPAGVASPMFSGQINVQQDGTVNGLSIVVSSLDFTITIEKTFANEAERTDYEYAVYSCSGRVNDATFEGFSAGEVLLKGGSGEQLDEDGLRFRWTLEFSYSQNVTGLTLPGLKDETAVPHEIDKKGWEYLWTRTSGGTVVIDGKTKATSKIDAALVEKVYELADFTLLEIV
jgi:hypothetical protein